MRKHKIPKVDIDVCCAEQKIAYNYLFAWSRFIDQKNGVVLGIKSDALDDMQRDLARRDWKYNSDLVYHIILANYDKYILSSHIFNSFEEIGELLTI